VVTGGASGIGRATAHALARHGAHLAIVDRDGPGADRVVSEVSELGADAHSFPTDLTDHRAIVTTIEQIVEHVAHIDILVNSAGVTGGRHDSTTFSDEAFEEVVAVNLRAPATTIREVGRHMVARRAGGRIVNLSSSAAFRATSSPALYAATKAAVNGLTRAAAADLGPSGVNVNAVAPGMTKTPMTATVGDDEAYRRIVSSGPLENLLHRPSEADDVAGVIVFLCLPESRQITGQVLNTSAGLVV
jgi:NAD(P)-dependent dehydrogenase (short-subunit alcohol dehydrogenase family)